MFCYLTSGSSDFKSLKYFGLIQPVCAEVESCFTFTAELLRVSVFSHSLESAETDSLLDDFVFLPDEEPDLPSGAFLCSNPELLNTRTLITYCSELEQLQDWEVTY